MRSLVTRFCHFYLSRPVASALVALLVLGVGVGLASRLDINSDQLDTLPDDLPAVQEARRVTEMIGGTGYFIIALKMQERTEGDELFYKALYHKRRSEDAQAEEYLRQAEERYDARREQNVKDGELLKAAADRIAERLRERDDVQYVQYKVDLSVVQQRILFFMQPEDLREAFRRISIKRDEAIERSSPFYIDLGQPAYRLDLSDIIEKYTTVGKKDITDNYNISPDRRMMMLAVKPTFSLNEIESSRAFQREMRAALNAMGLPEQGIEFGFTGAYAIYVDAYDSIQNSFRPTLTYALVGIALILALFIRRVTLIVSMLLALVYAVALTFGITYLAIGELNLITSMFGGILAGLGIDFGIHLVYRLREEYALKQDFIPAVEEAILHTGKAALYSVGSTTAAFAALIMSDFRGFSEFGLISAYGIILTFLCMFFLTPLFLALFLKVKPDLLDRMVAKQRARYAAAHADGRKPWAERLSVPFLSHFALGLFAVMIAAAGFFAKDLQWDSDTRNMIDNNVPAEELMDEIALRYDSAGAPSVIATESLDEARSVWEYFHPLTEDLDRNVSQVISPFSFVPPMHQQLKNYALMQRFRAESSVVSREMVPARFQNFYGLYQIMISQRPYGIEDVPASSIAQFRNIPESSIEGWLTVIYPEVSRLYEVSGVLEFSEQIGQVSVPIVGRHMILSLAYFADEWERRTGTRIPGDRQAKGGVLRGMQISEREINAALAIANGAEPAFLKRGGLSDLAVSSILERRPFASIAELQADRLEVNGTGSLLIAAKFMEIVFAESRFIIAASFTMVLIILWLSFRNIASSLTALAPLLVGVTLTAGAMTLCGVKLNYFNVAVLPIILGYGINNGIFMFHRYLESGSAWLALQRTGAAGLASSLTSLAGWGAIALAEHPGLKSMGYLASLGLLSMMAATLAFLPALLHALGELSPRLVDRMRGGKAATAGQAASADASAAQTASESD